MINAISLDEWVNKIPDEMIWKKTAEVQYQNWKELAAEFGPHAVVVGTHYSKSIQLPVVRIAARNGYFTLRDNFYDINLIVQWHLPLHIPLQEIYGEPNDWDWYLEQINKCRNYSYRGWTNEELQDPRILRVRSTNGSYWATIDSDRKDRWLNRMESTEWYSRDWSSARLIVEGKLEPGCKIYVASHLFAEGIPITTAYAAAKNTTYSPGGSTEFGLCLANLAQTKTIMRRIVQESEKQSS